MNKYLTVLASFGIMLCIGSIYAWSLIADELMQQYNFTASQSQIVFGTVIAVFPVSMIFVGQWGRRANPRLLGFLSGGLFLGGYMLAGHSQGSFLIIWTGIGLIGGVATGIGYWLSLTIPVQWFPARKGLITGIAAAGFGLGAVLMSSIAESMLATGKDVLQLFSVIGLWYGMAIVILANFVRTSTTEVNSKKLPARAYLRSPIFKRLLLGILLGTFAGLLIIGNLKIIGGQAHLATHTLVLGVSFFAVANFTGRILWGFIADYTGAPLAICCALLLQAIAILSLNLVELSEALYLLIAFMIGLGFGGNFVLFAKETAHVFGIGNLGVVYPFVFLGYAIAGITGPFAGGLLYDLSGAYAEAIFLSAFMSFAGSMLFLYQYSKTRNHEYVK